MTPGTSLAHTTFRQNVVGTSCTTHSDFVKAEGEKGAVWTASPPPNPSIDSFLPRSAAGAWWNIWGESWSFVKILQYMASVHFETLVCVWILVRDTAGVGFAPLSVAVSHNRSLRVPSLVNKTRSLTLTAQNRCYNTSSEL